MVKKYKNKAYLNKTFTIGLCGMTLSSVNYGVSALAYTHVALISKGLKKLNIKANLIFFSGTQPKDAGGLISEFENIQLIEYQDSAKLRAGIKGIFRLKSAMEKCDIIFDITQGDSFTDIYGYNRFILTTIEKVVAIHKCQYLIMSPQTLGPFQNKLCKYVAKYLLNKATKVYGRDEKSVSFVKEISKKCNINLTSDLAFELPYSKSEKEQNETIKIGINVSGLLWCNGYTGENEFGLTINYKDYTYKLIEYLLEKEKYEIYLIGHVFISEGLDDDYMVLEELKQKYNAVYLAPRFCNPIEAKTYISTMDIFIGARMHATIAAISTNVATIPVSYSRKFEGLYETINYYNVIKATEWTDDIAFCKTIDLLLDYQRLKKEAECSNRIVKNRNNVFEKDIIMYMEKAYQKKQIKVGK